MAAIALGLLTQAPAIVGAVGDTVHLVERLFGKGRGPDKKATVMQLTGTLIKTYAAVAPEVGLTGANSNDLAGALDNLVEAIVRFYNAAGTFAKTQTAPAGTPVQAPAPGAPRF